MPSKDLSTTASISSDPPLETVIERVILVAVLLFLVPGVLGWYGISTSRVTDSGSGYDLTVDFPDTTRAGLSSPWEAVVSHPGGFDRPVTLAVSRSYFELFDLNGFYPDAAATTTQGDRLLLEFDPPEGDTLKVHLDFRAQPDLHAGGSATTALLVDGAEVASVEYDTRLMP